MVGLRQFLRLLVVSMSLGASVGVSATASPAGQAEGRHIRKNFEAVRLSGEERRILQIALTFEGDYGGALDGVWDRASQAALETYARREFASPIRNAHVAALMIGFLAEVETRGWRYEYFPSLDLSLAMPAQIFGAPEHEDDGLRWWSTDGTLTLLTHEFQPDLAQAWHRAARAANAEPEALETGETAESILSAGYLDDGRSYYTITFSRGTTWPTIYLAGEPAAAQTLDFMRASIVEGEAAPWEMPMGGKLETILHETVARVDRGSEFDSFLPPEPVGVNPPDTSNASGTAFYVGPQLLLTANHVVDSCTRLGLADGTRLRMIASDAELDVAALAAEEASPVWLSLSEQGHGRLGERLHAIGYPYYNIAGTSLHLTSGNVSSLADVNDDRRFFSFSAPVQPGNSGGPLIDRDGQVMGLVVSRLSERYIAETTGTLPQNINYGLNRTELESFLVRNAIAAHVPGLARFDLEDGVPDGFASAVVPVLCD